jgi:trimethylamine--corrinoid protein Co-methyltransferase
VVADEVFGMVSRLLRGVAVDHEHLAVELIGQMGFRGDYLFAGHTREHVRELWQAKLGETGTYDGWLAAGSAGTADTAQARVDELLAAPAPEFPDELAREFKAVIAAAEC